VQRVALCGVAWRCVVLCCNVSCPIVLWRARASPCQGLAHVTHMTRESRHTYKASHVTHMGWHKGICESCHTYEVQQRIGESCHTYKASHVTYMKCNKGIGESWHTYGASHVTHMKCNKGIGESWHTYKVSHVTHMGRVTAFVSHVTHMMRVMSHI